MADTSFFDATNDLICAIDDTIQMSIETHENDDCQEEWETMLKEQVSPSSIDLLSSMFMPPVLKDDGVFALKNDKSEAPRQKQIDESHMLHLTLDSTKDASKRIESDDDLMSAAKRRIRRETNKTIKREQDCAGFGVSGGAVKDCDVHTNDEVLDTPSNRCFDETEALKCFHEFRKEVQAFTDQEKGFGIDGRIPSDRLQSFIARIESVYLQNNIDKLISAYHHDEAVRMKIKRVICSFVKRCKKNDLTMDKLNLFSNLLHNNRTAASKGKVLCKFKYWTCKLCGKNDLLFERNNCSVCGRPRRYRPLSPSHSVCESAANGNICKDSGDPVREEEQFLATNDFAPMRAQQAVRLNEQVDLDIVDERLIRQYLYKKIDYDSEVRTALRNEVKDLLSFITKPIYNKQKE